MPETQKLRILVVDDEPLARQRLEDLIARKEDVLLVGAVNSGRKAVEAIQNLQPDLVFLDVQMPGMTGIEVVQAVGVEAMPAVVFVTAYDQFALKAFDLAALDYLLKPFDDERFDITLERARQTLAMRDVKALQARLSSFFDREPSPTPRYLERFAVEMRGQVRLVDVRDIDLITASGAYVELHVGENKHLIRERMQVLEEQLDPALFFRIHRSTIVRLDQIDALLFNPGGDYAVSLKNGKRLGLSRHRREALEQRLGIDTRS